MVERICDCGGIGGVRLVGLGIIDFVQGHAEQNQCYSCGVDYFVFFFLRLILTILASMKAYSKSRFPSRSC